jgi:hypothetical protein
MGFKVPVMRATNEILIRRAYADDDTELRRLAILDSTHQPPAGPLLVAEIDGVMRVALSLSDGSVIADPFAATADVIELLRLRARVEAKRADARPRRRHQSLTAFS